MINDTRSSIFNEQDRLQLPHIRSFVRRRGRLTKGQQQALDNYWQIMGIEYQASPVELSTLFGYEAPSVLEIGFGMGASLVTMATRNPHQNFLGIEVHLPGIGACLASAYQAHLTNLRVICHDAVEVLQNMIPDNTLDKVQLFFPDPWHKLRHNKRRIVQTSFVEQVQRKLKMGGVFHMATDWQHYAEHMLNVMHSTPGYRNLSCNHDYVPRSDTRPLTKFELRGQRLGHDIWDLMFEKIM